MVSDLETPATGRSYHDVVVPTDSEVRLSIRLPAGSEELCDKTDLSIASRLKHHIRGDVDQIPVVSLNAALLERLDHADKFVIAGEGSIK